ncbi:MAG: hypothetical protein Q9159_001460 [Coniocarpon cinnabarinum]
MALPRAQYGLDAIKAQMRECSAGKPIRRTTVRRPIQSRPFSSSSQVRSQIGKSPISVPPECDLQIIQPKETGAQLRAVRKAALPSVLVKGPLGELQMELPAYLDVDWDSAARKATLSIQDAAEKKQKSMWGTTRAYLQNHILGVSEGHSCILRLVGVGYRATIERSAITVSPEFEGQQFVNLKVGYSHPIELPVPLGVKASTPQPTRILLEGIEKEVVKQFAANIRKWRVPEPYKGKGIFVDDETIKLKAKKIK